MQLTPKQFFRPDQSTACIQHQTGRSHSLKRDDISECKTQSSYRGDPFVSLISLALIDSLWGEWKMITSISSGLTSEHSVFYTSLKVNLEEEFYSGVQQEIKKKKSTASSGNSYINRVQQTPLSIKEWQFLAICL